MCDSCGGIHYPTESCEDHQAQLNQIREPSDLILNAHSELEKRRKKKR